MMQLQQLSKAFLTQKRQIYNNICIYLNYSLSKQDKENYKLKIKDNKIEEYEQRKLQINDNLIKMMQFQLLSKALLT